MIRASWILFTPVFAAGLFAQADAPKPEDKEKLKEKEDGIPVTSESARGGLSRRIAVSVDVFDPRSNARRPVTISYSSDP